MTAAKTATWFLKGIALTLITIGMWSIVFTMTEIEAGAGIKILLGMAFFGFGLLAWYLFDGDPLQSVPQSDTAPVPVFIPPQIPTASVIQFGQRQCVYLLYATTGIYKIGLTGHAYSRLSGFQTMTPCRVWFVALIPTTNMNALEKALHNQFASKRVQGEWFDLSADDVAYIQSLAGSD